MARAHRAAPRQPRPVRLFSCTGCGVCALCLLDIRQDAGRGLSTEELHRERIEQLYAAAAAARAAQPPPAIDAEVVA